MAEGSSAAGAGSTPAPSQSPGAESVQGGSQPGSSQPRGQAASEAGAPGEVADAAKAGARPIPPEVEERKRRSLPGVQTRSDIDVLLPPRDPSTGKFLKPSGQAGSDAVTREGPAAPASKPPAPGEAGAQPPKDTAAQPASEQAAKLKFLGKEMTLAEAEQSHKSLQGMFKSLNERASRAEADVQEGYKIGWDWKRTAEAHAARVAELEAQLAGRAPQSGSTGAGAASAPAGQAASDLPSVEDILKDIDINSFEGIAINDTLANAGKFLVQQTLNAVTTKLLPALQAQLRAEFSDSLAPFQEDAQASQMADAVERDIGQLSTLQNLNGQPAFPELSDHAKLVEIGRLWSEAGHNPEEALGPQGILKALAFYRMMTGLPSTPEAASILAAAAAPAGAGQPVAGPAASVEAEPGRGPNVGPRPNLSPGEQRLVSGLDRAMLRDPKLGFARNSHNRAEL